MSKLICIVEDPVCNNYTIKYCDKSGIKLLYQQTFIVTDDDIQWATEQGFITTEDVMCGEQTECDITAWLMVKEGRVKVKTKFPKYIICRKNQCIEDLSCRLEEVNNE